MRQKIENYIKCLGAALLTAAVALLSGCVDEELPDNRDLDYGYVQFRLLKEIQASPASKAEVPELDYLSDASTAGSLSRRRLSFRLLTRKLRSSASGATSSGFWPVNTQSPRSPFMTGLTSLCIPACRTAGTSLLLSFQEDLCQAIFMCLSPREEKSDSL